VTKILKTNSKKRLMKKETPTTKTTRLMLRMLAIGGLLTTSALTTTTAAFADSNAISRVERIFAALLGQPAQTGPPPHTYKDRTD
jgi:hypothetical protein